MWKEDTSDQRFLILLLIRCTGYRPILDAFKKFGSDAPGAKERVEALVADIEDLGLGGDAGVCKRTGKVRQCWER